jgi:hypothetical protein
LALAVRCLEIRAPNVALAVVGLEDDRIRPGEPAYDPYQVDELWEPA